MSAIVPIGDQVRDVVAKHFKRESVALAAHVFDDLGADSLDLIEIVMEIEEHFGIELPESALEGAGPTVADYVALVEKINS